MLLTSQRVTVTRAVIHKPEGDSDQSKHDLLRKEECAACLPGLGMRTGRTDKEERTPPRLLFEGGSRRGAMPAASKGCRTLRRGSKNILRVFYRFNTV